jgi:hypothetical protein
MMVEGRGVGRRAGGEGCGEGWWGERLGSAGEEGLWGMFMLRMASFKFHRTSRIL